MRLIALNTTLAAIAELPTFGIVETSTSSIMEPAAFSAMVADSRIGCFPRESAAEITSATRCSTKYGASARPWGPSTDYFTSTSYAYRTKTELLTPKPSITSLSATSTYTEFETAPNNLTKTVYTDTYTWTNYLTTTETVSSIVTVTTSVLQNFTIPTPAGFTAVGAAYPEATQHVDDWVDQDDWSVEDAYWQDQNDYQYGPPPEPELPETSRAGEPTKVDCLVTLVSIYDAGTTTSRSYVPPPTYTRTTYVATETITTTVRTKISPTETPWTYSAASAKEEKSWYTETRTNVDTTTTTEFPSSTVSVYAACATDNIVDTYNGFPLNSLADDWYNKNYTVIRTDWSEATNATACCATAAAIPSAIFFKYDGICEVFVDDKGHGYNASKIDVEVLYEPRERGWWGPTFGNGPRGSIRFSSLWL